jgi:toxin secretion/phage lysis holin
MKENITKGVVAVVLGGLTAFLGDLAIPIYVLVACNVIDYATGLMSAKARGEQISSYKGIQGIAKKIGQWLLVLVGWLLDVLIAYAVHHVSPELSVPVVVAIIVAVWLGFNEVISILENLGDMGVPMPPFLKKIVQNLKGKIEDIGETVE